MELQRTSVLLNKRDWEEIARISKEKGVPRSVFVRMAVHQLVVNERREARKAEK